MSNVGGDITEITFTHPTIGSGTFYAKSGEDAVVNYGGLRSADEVQNITGNGDNIDIMTNSRWRVEVVCAWSTTEREDSKVLNELAASTVPADWTFQHVSGAIYGAKGKPVGDLDGSLGNATFTLITSGGQKAKRIV